MSDAAIKPQPRTPRPLFAVTVWLGLSLLLLALLVLTGVLPAVSGLLLWPVLWAAATIAIGFVRVHWGVCVASSVLTGVGLLGVLVAINFKAVKVEGTSMQPTFQPGDVLLVDLTEAPGERYGIFTLNLPDDDHAHVIKRVVGLPGESMDVRYARVFADGQEVYPRDGSASDTWNETRPAHARFYNGPRDNGGGYFVLGDNPPDSRDSRHFGALDESAFEGRVVWSLRGSHGFGPVR